MMIAPPQSECFLNTTQEYLVSTTIHKAKNLPVYNMDTYVKVSLEKKSKCTKVFQNSENPYYNEYFVFELSCTLAELLRLTVLYEVKKKTCCKVHVTLGELLIDLHTVWNQPNKSFTKKWGKLENSIGANSETKGHLQIDLAIVSPNQPAVPAIMSCADCDDIESNLLQSLQTSPCNTQYTIFFYKGVFQKKSDYMLQVSLAGMNGKTKVHKGSTYPEWNEQIRFLWTYPSLAQTFLVQVMAHEHLHWKCVAENEIYFDEISFNAVPSLGPTYVHFYDFSTYVGRVLMEIKAEKMNAEKESINRTITTQGAPPFSEREWWESETFIVEFLMWQGEFVNANASNMKVVMKLGEHTSDTVECFLNNYTGSAIPIKCFTHAPPFKAIHIKCMFPDSRLKYESDHFMVYLVEQMKYEMENFKLFQLKYPGNDAMHSKCLKAIVVTILGKIEEPKSDSRFLYKGFKQQTVWDENRSTYLKDFFDRLTTSLKELREKLKATRDVASTCDSVYQELQQLRGQIVLLMQSRIQDEWPELHLLMCLGSGKGVTKEFAICKLNALHFVHSQRDECSGRWCGVPRNFVFKDTTCAHTCKNCGCTRGFVYGWLRIATEAEQTEFSASSDWEEKERFYYQPKVEPSDYLCRLYIHQAKIQPGADKNGLCDAKLRVFSGHEVVETTTIYSSLSPVWNESVGFAVRQMPGNFEWYEKNPPLLAVQLYDVDAHKADDYLGCGLIALSVQGSVNRKEPLKSIQDITDAEAQAGGDGNHPANTVGKRGFHSKSAVFNFMKLVRTRVALQKLQELRFLSPPTLKWVPIAFAGVARVEVLMSGELLQVADGESPDGPRAILVVGIPKDIQPVMGRFLLEVTIVGLRSCQKLSSSSLGRYKINIMMGELFLQSGVSGTRLKNSINFLENYASGAVNLPKQLEYWPAIIATHIDCPGRKREVTLGATLISNPSKYLKQEVPCDLAYVEESTIVQMGEGEAEESAPLLPPPPAALKKSLWQRFKAWLRRLFRRRPKPVIKPPDSHIDESEFNWWTKFYNSMYMQKQHLAGTSKHKLVIYGAELEKEPDFSFLSDWAEAFPLVHGVKIKKNKPPKEEVYATLKMKVKLTQCQCRKDSSFTLNSVSRLTARYQTLSALTDQTKVVVRIYLVQGMQLRSHDKYSQSDSYVKLQLGAQTISDRAHYVPNQSNPIFGKRFQMEAVIPREHILQISVFDRGIRDDLIGSTFIDLEDRLRTKHRATVGLANEFNRFGYNMWRDAMTPFEILKDICKQNHVAAPVFEQNTVEIGGVMFEDTTVLSTEEDLQERLSLSVLKNIQDVRSIGYRLVPEHVETRSLYRNDRPGVEQGKLQLWIEIFEPGNLPPPLDITPIPARNYELRIIVCNCSDVESNEANVFGTKMSDLYVKAWCEDSELYQTTDIHYRSLTGEGNFNWRMIFPVKYSTNEDMMVIKRKEGLLEQYETKQPPMVYLQIWDNDSFSSDDFLAALEICLSSFTQPAETKVKCIDAEQAKKKGKMVNLFREKTVKGWFPCRGNSAKGKDILAGKLELELEILTENEAASNPAGLGRSPPNALANPERPDTSFNPMTSPVKAFKHILGPVLKHCLCFICLAIGVLAVLMLFIEDLPNMIMEFFNLV